MIPPRSRSFRPLAVGIALAACVAAACVRPPDRAVDESATADPVETVAQVEAALWAFHAADTTRDAEAVIALLWPEYSMFVDGTRLGYDEVASGTRAFMAGLTRFHTEWNDVQVTPLGGDAAVASFQFRDSIVTQGGEVVRSRGTTTFVWQRRDGEWRLLFADANHRSIPE